MGGSCFLGWVFHKNGYIHKIENRVCEKEVTFCRSIVRNSLAFSVFADVCAVSVSTDKKVSK